jgi:hypothetical protein
MGPSGRRRAHDHHHRLHRVLRQLIVLACPACLRPRSGNTASCSATGDAEEIRGRPHARAQYVGASLCAVTTPLLSRVQRRRYVEINPDYQPSIFTMRPRQAPDRLVAEMRLEGLGEYHMDSGSGLLSKGPSTGLFISLELTCRCGYCLGRWLSSDGISHDFPSARCFSVVSQSGWVQSPHVYGLIQPPTFRDEQRPSAPPLHLNVNLAGRAARPGRKNYPLQRVAPLPKQPRVRAGVPRRAMDARWRVKQAHHNPLLRMLVNCPDAQVCVETSASPRHISV